MFGPELATAHGILIAVSGGADSMALMALLARWQAGKATGHTRLAALTIDHGLRPESVAEAALVADVARRLGVVHVTLPWQGEKPRTGLQNAARKARYQLLTEHAKAQDFSHLITAHHADDQAETVVMRLAAGSGIAGLAAMRHSVLRQGIVHLRPLLDITKSRLIATCAALDIPFVTDPSNTDPRYGRTRIRGLMARLATEGLTTARLTRLAARAADAEEALSAATMALMQGSDITTTGGITRINWLTIMGQPRAIRLRLLTSLLQESHTQKHEPFRLERLEALLEAIDGAAHQGLRLRRSIGDRIVTLQPAGILTITAAPPRQRGAQ